MILIKDKKTDDVLKVSQIRISSRLKDWIKIFAAKQSISVVEAANVILTRGIDSISDKKFNGIL